MVSKIYTSLNVKCVIEYWVMRLRFERGMGEDDFVLMSRDWKEIFKEEKNPIEHVTKIEKG